MIKARLGADFDRVVKRAFPFLERLRLRPDTLTVTGVLVSGASGLAFAWDEPQLAALLLLLAGFFDLVDGVVARIQGSSSAFGAFFDSSMDRVSELLVFAGIGFAMASHGDGTGVLLLFWAVLGSFMTSYIRARAEKDLSNLSVGLMERAERCVILILGGLTGFVQVALLIIALGSTWTAAQRIWAAHRLLQILDDTGQDPTLEAGVEEASHD